MEKVTYSWNKRKKNNHYTSGSQLGVFPWDTGHCLEIFLVITTQGHATGIQWIEARNMAKRSTGNSYDKNYLAPNA